MLVLIKKRADNGWPKDEPFEMIDDSLLVYAEGVDEDDTMRMHWKEWRLDGLIVKRGGHLFVKSGAQAGGKAANFT